jgi:RNA polymerase sigma factor (sigma-70 family)
MRTDPLANPEPLIHRVYSYVAYRLGDGADAEDVTSEVFERALRYRGSFDESRGAPLHWLLGIARRCVQDALAGRRQVEPLDEIDGQASPEDIGRDAVERLTLSAAVARLDERARDLLALRYGADLTARQIGQVTGLSTNAVEVALHRALSRLRSDLTETVDAGTVSPARAAHGLSGPGTAS